MTVLRSEVRHGEYRDSIVLMQLQAAVAERPGVLDAAAVMASPENLALLEPGGLLPDIAEGLEPTDLLVVVKAESEDAAREALASVDSLLVRNVGGAEDFRARSLESAASRLPDARWALVSVPGRFAADVARESLELGLHVFLYSDNVTIDDEIELKEVAQAKGLLVMGPDCGTAIVGGVGFGFANRVRRGAIGLIGASGTGLQAVSAQIHALGAGVSAAIGTGGRDLSEEVGGLTTLQAIDLLRRDPHTEVIVLVSKPPDPATTSAVLTAAAACGKPAVVRFLGITPPARRIGPLRFAAGLHDAAEVAVGLLDAPDRHGTAPERAPAGGPTERGYVRGLFSGGTLAYETVQALRVVVEPVFTNMRLEGVELLWDPWESEGHAILDLGADEFTVGRPHPIIDHELRIRRLRLEAADPEVSLILFDVLLGDGAHPDPAEELAVAVEEARASRGLEFIAIIVGTEDDPQGLTGQVEKLERAGVTVVRDVPEAVSLVWSRLGATAQPVTVPVPLEDLDAPVAALNVGLEVFHQSLIAQGARSEHVDWRPPAGGNERLLAILEKMKR